MLAVFTYANELGFEPGLDSPEFLDEQLADRGEDSVDDNSSEEDDLIPVIFEARRTEEVSANNW